MTFAVELRDLKKCFRKRSPSARSFMGTLRGLVAPKTTEFRAVDGISFAIEPGERVAFIGPNGAGKSTTLKILYLAVTEWIALSQPPLVTDIEADIRSGNIAYSLPRPISYLWLRFSEAFGTLLVRMLVLGVFGFGMSLLLAGGSDGSGAGLPSGGVFSLLCGALTAVVAATLNLVFCALIGLSAFFLEDTSPVYWAWQKLSFVAAVTCVALLLFQRGLHRYESGNQIGVR